MKVLLVNGGPHKEGCTYTALSEVAKELNKEGIETEIFWIGVKPISGCIACGKCFENGKCVFNDVVNELNFVEDDERKIFFDTLNKNNIDFIHYDTLNECLKDTYQKADDEDIILLIGAQGMDPAESILKDII